MATFLLVAVLVGLVVLALHAALAVGLVVNLRRDLRSRPQSGAAGGLDAEVVVAVRNEAEHLPRLLDSLARQSEPCRFLFVDDRSSDETPAILKSFCSSMPERARYIRNDQERSGLTGKHAALELAFQAHQGAVLLFTDADCTLPPGWVAGMRSYFQDPKVGAVIGRIELPWSGGLLGRFQAFEQPLINQYNLGACGIGMPMGCFGNNMAVRAEALERIGGFRALGYTVTEDAALVGAVANRTDFAVRASTLASTAVMTMPKKSWREYLNQHTRWNAGAFSSSNLATKLSYGFIVWYLILSLVALPFGLLDWRLALLAIGPYVSIGLLGVVGGKATLPYCLWFVPNLLIFGFFYALVSLRALVRAPFEWKGIELTAWESRSGATQENRRE